MSYNPEDYFKQTDETIARRSKIAEINKKNKSEWTLDDYKEVYECWDWLYHNEMIISRAYHITEMAGLHSAVAETRQSLETAKKEYEDYVDSII